MSEDLHHIDKIFKDSIEEHEEMPSQHVWDVIDSNLDKNKINHSSRKYNRLKRVAILLVLILLSITIYDLDMKYPVEEVAKGNNNILITHKKEISKNDSDTGQNSIRKQNHDNQTEEAIKEAEIINVDDNVQPGNSIGKSDDVTAAIGKKNITRGVTADKSKNRNENR